MVDRALSAIKHRGVSNAVVARMDAIALAFPGRVFDTVLCGFALNGLPALALSDTSPVYLKASSVHTQRAFPALSWLCPYWL
jgi:hypothetical protein